jgi:hypothetical protein
MKMQMSRIDLITQRNPIVYLLLLTVFVHGLALINNGIYWDGALLYGFYQENNLEQLRLLSFSMGMPLFYYIERGLWWLGYGAICNFINVVAIFLVAVFSCQAARLFHSINKTSAFLLAAFIILFPGSMVTVYQATTPYYLLYGLFFAAFYLGLRFEIGDTSQRYILRFGSLILFFISFSLKSLLAYYLLYLICAYILYSRESAKTFWQWQEALRFVVQRIDFLCLPMVFWVLCQWFFTPFGDYSEYNQFQNLSLLQLSYYFFFSMEFVLVRYLWLPALIFGGVWLVSRMLHLDVKQHAKRVWQPYLSLILLGVVALCMAVIPYILVGKPPIYDTLPETRGALLVPVAAALLLTGFIGLFFSTTHGHLTKLGRSFVVIFAIWFGVIWGNNYLRLEAEAALKQAFVYHLKQNPAAIPYSVYWIQTGGLSGYLQLSLVPYEWAFLLNEAYAGHTRYGFSNGLLTLENYISFKRNMTRSYENQRYNVRNFNPDGCQVVLTLGPRRGIGPLYLGSDEFYYNQLKPYKITYLLNPGFIGLNPLKLSINYLYYRFINTQQMDEFLDNVMTMQVLPLSEGACRG